MPKKSRPDIGLLEYSKKHTSAATQIVVTEYPNNPTIHYVIDYLDAGGSAAGSIQLLDDTNTVIDGYYWNWAAGKRAIAKNLINLPVNRGFRYTTTDGGNHNVIIKYHIEYIVPTPVPEEPPGEEEPLAGTFSSRTTGVAPLAVFFDAVNTASPAYDSGVEQPDDELSYQEFDYAWDFGDSGSGSWPDGTSKNFERGYTAAHVFENAGTYSVTLTVTNSLGVETVYTQDIVVGAFGGTTFYISSSDGSDSDDGLTEGTAWATVAKMYTEIGTNRRFLFKRGDTFPVTANGTIDEVGPGIIAAYGVGADPIWDITPDATAITVAASDWRIVDLELNGNGSAGQGINVSNAAQRTELLFLNINVHDFGLNYVWNDNEGAIAAPDKLFIIGGESRDAADYCAIIDSRRTAIVGCVMSGAGQHVIRPGIMDKGVIAHNELSDGAVHIIKLHSSTDGSGRSVTRFVNIYKNEITGGQISLSIEPQNNVLDERVTQIIVESNTFGVVVATSDSIRVAAQWVTIRNNTSLGNGSNDHKLVFIHTRGIEPNFENIFVVNNSTYVGTIQDFFKMVSIENAGSNVLLMNNICSAPDVSDRAFLEGTCTNLTNTDNVMTDTPGFADPDNGDFSLALGSEALDVGTTNAIAKVDKIGTSRPQGGGYDLGAYEKA